MYPVPAYPSHTCNCSQLSTKWTTMMKSEGKLITLSTRDDVTQTIMKNSLYQREGIVSDIVARHILNEMIQLGETEGIIKRLCPQLAPKIYDFFTEVGRLYCAMVINLPKVICPYQRQPHLKITIRGAYLRWKRLDACLPPPAKSEVVIDSKGLKYDKMRENQEERNKEEPEPKFRLRVSRMGGYPYGGGYQAIPRGRSPSPSPVAMPTAVIGGAAMGMSYEGSMDVGHTNNRAERQAANAERKTYRRMQKDEAIANIDR
ncbi:hypothetical protein F5051DRAFT_431245 [Lentinula edodes]|nr:hypothetical protein F5051DRAFT_431245 [Lentinula edodes]